MNITDIFIKRPVLATVVSLMILVMGIRAAFDLPVRQYPYTENGVITITTSYFGADPDVVAGFITTPLEASIAQAEGIDYMTSSSTLSTSIIQVNLLLNYDSNRALSEINTKVQAVLNQLPKETQTPVLTVAIGETLDAMYIGFYSNVLQNNQITDYLIRVVQPQFQAINGVKTAEILGNKTFAMRIWLDPIKLAGHGITAQEVYNALGTNDFISAVGRTDGQMIAINLTAETGLHSVKQFQDLVIRHKGNTLIRVKDVGTVTLGSENTDSAVSFDGEEAVYIGIKVAPAANLLTVVDNVRKIFPDIERQLPQGLNARIVYDSTTYVKSSVYEVIKSLVEALVIVTAVIYIFLGTVRSVVIPVIAMPLSLIGTFTMMLILGYSINLLTLLALVLGIGLVVDDAIIVVENISRHMEEGLPRLKASFLGAAELANPVIAISIVLIAVYIPIGFMGGLTGALFTEFAFTLAGAVGVSAVIALTLSPMMCSKLLITNHDSQKSRFIQYIDAKFENLKKHYERGLHHTLENLPVVYVFSAIILVSIYFLYSTSKSELAPQEDQGIILAQGTTAPNASLYQTILSGKQIYKTFTQHPETEHVFQIEGSSGLNSVIAGMVLKPWEKRKKTSNDLQPVVQQELSNIAGAKIAVFQLPSLPGSSGLPIQVVILTTDPFTNLNDVTQTLFNKMQQTGMYVYLDADLKIDKLQSTVVFNRDKAGLLGINMQSVGSILSSYLSQGYVNYFSLGGRSYKVIPQAERKHRLNDDQILDYYITTDQGNSILASTIASIRRSVVPESLNHFQQLNSATISGVLYPGLAMGDALDNIEQLASDVLPQGYKLDFAGLSRQYVQEGNALVITFFFAIIIIFLTLAALFESFRDPLIVLISVPMSICGALIFVSIGLGGASLNIYTEVGLVTLIGLISKHGILIVQFANDLQLEGKSKLEAIQMAATIRLRPILMTTAAMVLGVIPLIFATGAGAVSRYNIGLVISTGISIGTLFTLFVVPAMYMLLADTLEPVKKSNSTEGNDALPQLSQ